jgi:2-hydroxychromene-2-carboxylate isomerase
MSTSRPSLEFWYEFASTYSYLSAMRIETVAEQAGIGIVWKPFVLGPIFHAQGWNTSPFNIYPAKGRYMVREMERLTSGRGLPFKMPQPFPQNSLNAARLALIGHDEGCGPAFTRAVYTAQFAEGANISDKAVLGSILAGLDVDPAPRLARSSSQILSSGYANKPRRPRNSASSARRRSWLKKNSTGATTAWSRRSPSSCANETWRRAVQPTMTCATACPPAER